MTRGGKLEELTGAISDAHLRLVDSLLAHGHTVESRHLGGQTVRHGSGPVTARVVVAASESGAITVTPTILAPPFRDWPSFWSGLTPAEVAEALRAAPMVAGPWEYDTAEDGWYRRNPRRDEHFNVAGASEDGWWVFFDYKGGRVDSLVAAKHAADEALRAKGWLLL